MPKSAFSLVRWWVIFQFSSACYDVIVFQPLFPRNISLTIKDYKRPNKKHVRHHLLCFGLYSWYPYFYTRSFLMALMVVLFTILFPEFIESALTVTLDKCIPANIYLFNFNKLFIYLFWKICCEICSNLVVFVSL